MVRKKNKILTYSFLALLVLIMCTGQVNASVYENYNGIEMTNSEYNTLLNLGFTEDEIYYMNEDTYLENKDLDATLVSQTDKYYKTIYNDLNGNPHSIEITESEYQNQPTTRGTVTTEYKHMVSTLSQNGSKYRFKVSLSWRILPATKSYDIIGVGFEPNNIKIDSNIIYFSYHWCNTSGTCKTDAYYQNKKSTSTGGAAVYDLPDSLGSLSTTLYYDVVKINTSNTVTNLRMYGDYAHAQSNVPVGMIDEYEITHNGIEFYTNLAAYYDEIPTAVSSWSGTW